jgi:aldehyde dehydrogenase (NAD+)
MNTIEQIEKLRRKQISFFSSGATRDIKFRRRSLVRLRDSILRHDKDIKDALRMDLNKSSFETYATETGLVLHELRSQIRNISKWARTKAVWTPLFAMPSRSMIVPEPYGEVFIISPWNYPFQLPMVPLIGAIAAGNVAMIRQSRFSPNTNSLIREILNECFSEDHVAIIDCDIETAEAALKLRWDTIFFTGSTAVGKKIYAEAALNLTPVILELGGKSPVIIEEDAVISVAAKRIIWGKLINAGQSCISPDYVFVNARVKDALVGQMKLEINNMYGDNPIENPDYPKIISEKAFNRITSYFNDENVITGGRADLKRLSIEPTIIKASLTDKCMEDEIFGPVLPVITYSGLDEVIGYINSKEKPLAIYYFSTDRKKQNRMIRETSSGACLINDVILHIANKNLPYGGVGGSGLGRYHGKESFRVFSNMKAVMKTSASIDIPLKYPPFKNKERILKLFLK